MSRQVSGDGGDVGMRLGGFISFLAFPVEIRKLIYTTDDIVVPIPIGCVSTSSGDR